MKTRKGKVIYRSMREFEKEFFPKSLKKRSAEKPKDAQALGVSLAKETMEKVKGSLIETHSS